ncbi:TetR/AcrR family transcriptional regulator [Candidatus Zixiibacteriota bacterium]
MYNAKNTKVNLLAAARELFAERGYDNTSIRAITSLAQANLGAVTYHFESKENLYREVFRAKAKPLLSRLMAIADGPGPPLARIEMFARQFFEFLLDNRELPALLLHEIALNRPVPEPIRAIMERLFGYLIAMIQQGQKEGSVVDGDPALLAISTFTQPAHVAILRQVLNAVFSLDLDRPDVRQATIDHVADFMRRGLRASGRQGL